MKSAESKQSAITQAYKTAFNTLDGKLALHDMMKVHYLLSPTYTKKIDPYEMAFNEGQRSVVLRILSILDIDMEALREFIKQQKEQGDDYAR